MPTGKDTANEAYGGKGQLGHTGVSSGAISPFGSWQQHVTLSWKSEVGHREKRENMNKRAAMDAALKCNIQSRKRQFRHGCLGVTARVLSGIGLTANRYRKARALWPWSTYWHALEAGSQILREPAAKCGGW